MKTIPTLFPCFFADLLSFYIFNFFLILLTTDLPDQICLALAKIYRPKKASVVCLLSLSLASSKWVVTVHLIPLDSF